MEFDELSAVLLFGVALGAAALLSCTAPRTARAPTAAPTAAASRTVVIHVDKMMKSKSGAT